MSVALTKDMILKWDVQGPRYTSYPTAPVWQTNVTAKIYEEKLRQFGQTDKTLSLYIHIPFCETMCTYCACSVLLRPNDPKYAEEYLIHLFQEIELVAHFIGTRKAIRQFHWGGGTPTFLNEDQLQHLFQKVGEHFDLDYNGEIAIEVDPRTVSREKVYILKRLGFNRISFGVQDFNTRVQEAVNRIQSFDLVRAYNEYCRRLGFSSINFDLIYGLPYQTRESFADTVQKVITLRPDRIALYSFAYVPWLKKHQNKMDPAALPTGDAKMDIFLQARKQLLAAGYQAIAMDHFALREDELAKAYNTNQLYRNFMGYTVKPADEYIGLGLSSIGFLEKTFIQNRKVLKDYYADLAAGRLPVERGKELNPDDERRQWTIHALMCHFGLNKKVFLEKFGESFDAYFWEEQEHLQKCLEDGLIEMQNNDIKVTESGKLFIRNICMGFDAYLARQQREKQQFSRTV